MATIGNLVVNIIAKVDSMQKGSLVSRVAMAGVQTAAIAGGIALAKYATGINSTIGLFMAAGRAGMRLASSLAATVGGWSTIFTWAMRVGRALIFSRLGILGVASAVGVMATAFVGAGVAMGASAIHAAADFERLEVSFSTMLGSGEKAKALLDDISSFAAQTPLEFNDLAGAGRSLLAFGVGSDSVVDKLREIGDVASGVGAPIGEIADIYGKVRVQGRLFAEDINQFQGRGIPIMQALASQFGVTTEEIRAMVTAGKIGTAEFESAFASLSAEGGRFHGMMEAQSKTVHGLTSTIKDNLSIAFRDLGVILTEQLGVKSALEGIVELTSVIQGAAEMAKNLSSWFGGFKLGDEFKLLMKIATFGSIFKLPGKAKEVTEKFMGKEAEDARGKKLEEQRLAAIAAEEQRWSKGFTSRRETNEQVKAMFFDTLPAVNKEAAADAARRSGMSRLQTTDTFRSDFMNFLGPEQTKEDKARKLREDQQKKAKAQKPIDEMFGRGADLEKEFETPAQKMSRRFGELVKLNAIGALSDQGFAQGLKEIKADFAKESKGKKEKSPSEQFASAVQKGSGEEFNQVVKSILGDNKADKQIKVAETQVAVSRDTLRATQEIARSTRDTTTVAEVV